MLLEPKIEGTRPKKFFPALSAGLVPPLLLRTGAPTFKFVPAPLWAGKRFDVEIHGGVAMDGEWPLYSVTPAFSLGHS